MPPSVIVFRGKVADHNERAMVAAPLLGDEIARRLGCVPTVVGTPQPINNHGWVDELDAAEPELRELAREADAAWSAGNRPILALSRNTASLATLPVLAAHHPDAVMVWIGADTSLHTPATTRTGYLGGMVLAATTGLWESPLGSGLLLSHIAFCGTRDVEPVEQLLIEAGVIAHIHLPGDPLADLEATIDGRPVFVHFACDALRPGIVPTDYTIAGGYTVAQMTTLVDALAAQNVIGVEIAELEAPLTGSAAAGVSLIADLLRPLIEVCAAATSAVPE